MPHKADEDVVKFYYYWKKSPGGLANRNMRKTRKSMHLKKTHSENVSSYTCLYDLFVDVLSCDESEPSYPSKDNERCHHTSINEPQYYICQHCYCTKSKSWHHGGCDNTLLCDVCRIYFCKYGQMRVILSKSDPPIHILKNPSNLELLRQIDAGKCTIQNKIEDEQVESSDISESSDYESNLSEVEKFDTEIPKHYLDKFSLCEQVKCSNTIYNPSDASIQDISSLPTNANHFSPRTELLTNSYHKKSSDFQAIPDLCHLPNLHISSEIKFNDLHSLIQHDDTPNNLSSSNTSILQSLLQSSDEKPLTMRSV